MVGYNPVINYSEESWHRVRSLFHDAVGLPISERQDFFSAITDPSLRTELQGLLAAADQLGIDFIEQPAFVCLGSILNDRYEIQKVLGRGGQATVLLAQDLQTNGREVVIKVLNTAGEHAEWLRRRFDKERKILASLQHPGIVGVQDQGNIAGSPFLVMEYVSGKTLRETLQQQPSNVQIAKIVRQMGSALRAAHIRGICHRDLKPENVMITLDLSVKLIDFGIAQFDRQETGATTTVLITAGTTRYMAPEQFLGISDARSDIYSFALVIFEMLAGRCPYDTGDALELARVQRTRSIRSILLDTPKIPRSLRLVLAAALSLDPDQRPTNAEVFANDVTDAILVPKPALTRRFRKWSQWLMASWPGRAAFVSLVLIVSVWLMVPVWQEAHAQTVYET